jgi:predicted peptidase
MRLWPFLFLALTAFLVPCTGCRSSVNSMQRPMSSTPSFAITFQPRSISVNGVEHKYALYVPAFLARDQPAPLIVFLNGRGECGTDGVKQTTQGLGNALRADPAAWPFVCVFPQKPDAESTWLDHEALVLGVLEKTRGERNIDPDRLYLTGLSQGGRGTWAIGTRHPDLFAALAPICGFGPDEQLGTNLRGLPIWAFHGEADRVVPAAESLRLAKAASERGGDVKLTLYLGVDHNSWDKAYREERLGEWLLACRRRPE